jgi:hypothetical protein
MAQAITDADVKSLAQKLTQFNQTLTPGEQTALATVILRGALRPEDLEGFSQSGPQGGQNVGAVGAQEGGDPFSPIINIFAPPSLKGRDRPSERK